LGQLLDFEYGDGGAFCDFCPIGSQSGHEENPLL